MVVPQKCRLRAFSPTVFGNVLPPDGFIYTRTYPSPLTLSLGNCQPRLPAQHFQTKNGGKNHGRWFYTCQQPQPKRCNFFLWDDEAKPREEAAVLNNSRSEPRSEPATPSRNAPNVPPHEQTFQKSRSPSATASPSPMRPSSATTSKTTAVRNRTSVNENEQEDFFDWSLSDDEELQISKAVDRASTSISGSLEKAMFAPQTPRKAAKLDTCTSPGKRRRSSTEKNETRGWTTPGFDDPFVTPRSMSPRKKLFVNTSELETPTSKSNGRNLMSPSLTPTPSRYRNLFAGKEEDSALATDSLGLLESYNVDLNQEVRGALTQLLNKHAAKAQGIARGRDISRIALKTKEVKITELQSRIASLEAERETDKAVIRHLRRANRSQSAGDHIP